MFLFCKKLIFSGIATHWPVDKDSGVKTPFWAIIKKTQKIVKAVSAQKFVKAVSAQKFVKAVSAQIGSKLYRLKKIIKMHKNKNA